tara:strand:+ start:223 stop:423 length:201 start_codon:yes stop_codon:yes gene_type:complete
MKVAGVEYEVNWRAFTKGRSLFFPCLDSKRAWHELKPVLHRLQLKVVRKSVVDLNTGVRGLRIWRL